MSDTLIPIIDAAGVTVFIGDTVDMLPMLEACSVDSVVTDPPYGLEFAGQDWDSTTGFLESLPHLDTSDMTDGDIFEAWTQAWATGALRLLRPGGHMAVFGGTRMWHRMATGVEKAGFQIRDQIAWLYSTGMPKSLDLSNAADQHLGAERADRVVERSDAETLLGRTSKVLVKGQPVTDQARRLEGVGTGLKPGFEPILIARKPVEGSIVNNVLTFGTGGLNIADCRTDSGRWPVNVGLDEQISHELDFATGTRWSSAPVSEKFQVFRFDGKAPQVERPRAYGVVHTTVKPLSLMRWLVRLVTPRGGVVLEPFAGSGSTIEAALLEGRRVVAIEKDESYVGLISQRIRRAGSPI